MRGDVRLIDDGWWKIEREKPRSPRNGGLGSVKSSIKNALIIQVQELLRKICTDFVGMGPKSYIRSKTLEMGSAFCWKVLTVRLSFGSELEMRPLQGTGKNKPSKHQLISGPFDKPRMACRLLGFFWMFFWYLRCVILTPFFGNRSEPVSRLKWHHP